MITLRRTQEAKQSAGIRLESAWMEHFAVQMMKNLVLKIELAETGFKILLNVMAIYKIALNVK